MKKQKIIFLLVVLLTLLSGCKSRTEFTLGEWKENQYENSWINMRFEVPTDWTIATQEEINELVGAGAETLNVEGTSEEQLKAMAKLKAAYPFLVSNPSNTINVQLVFENLAMTIGGTKYTVSEYMNQLSDMLLQQEAFQYELLNQDTVELAGKQFEMIRLSAYGGAMHQEYYAHKMGKYMASIIISYASDAEDEKNDFINKISAIK